MVPVSNGLPLWRSSSIVGFESPLNLCLRRDIHVIAHSIYSLIQRLIEQSSNFSHSENSSILDILSFIVSISTMQVASLVHEYVWSYLHPTPSKRPDAIKLGVLVENAELDPVTSKSISLAIFLLDTITFYLIKPHHRPSIVITYIHNPT